MEIFKSDDLKRKAYRSVFVQKGGNLEMDRYIYGMQGEGLGNFFGTLMKQAIPLISGTIKGIAKTAKPIAVAAGKEIITTGVKRGAETLTKRLGNKNQKIVHRPHKKVKRRGKWRNL